MAQVDFDILIVGSGPSGIQAAKEAIQHGARVGLVDVGYEDQHYAALTPDKPFTELRSSDPDQHKYFLGEALEGVIAQNQEVGVQLTPARQIITYNTETLLPIESNSFQAAQSLALGGLGAGWGAGCACYEPDELALVGLPQQLMNTYYERVAREIGVSGPKEDDISEHVSTLETMQPPLEPDSNAQALWASYLLKRKSMLAKGFKLGRPMAAILTKGLGSRQPNSYNDMDFWSDAGESIYRPRYTLRELQTEQNFKYLRPYLAEKFEESKDGIVSLLVQNLITKQNQTFRARRLLLGAGAINTARLALRSLNRFGTRVPLLSNPYTYLPVINLPMLGRPAQDRRHSMVQLTGVYLPSNAPEDQMGVQFYSYRSLLLFKLAQGIPLPPLLAMIFSRAIVNSLFIVGANHADETSPDRWLAVERKSDESDYVKIHSERSPAARAKRIWLEMKLIRRLTSLKLAPLTIRHLPEGSSIHYAGTLPFSEESRPLTCDPDGRLREMCNVFAVDGSTWKYLPAKGLTFSLMANARRITEQVVGELKEQGQ